MIMDREQNKNLKRTRSGSTSQTAETLDSLDSDEPYQVV